MSKYQLMPEQSDEEFETLKSLVLDYGVLQPVHVDEDGAILDGHHRVRACKELGIRSYPRIVHRGLTEEQKYELVLTLNLTGREVSRERRREIVANLREKGWSLRRIAEALGVDAKTVRNDLSAGGEYSPPATIAGLDGKEYPAARPPSEIPTDDRSEPAPEPPPPPTPLEIAIQAATAPAGYIAPGSEPLLNPGMDLSDIPSGKPPPEAKAFSAITGLSAHRQIDPRLVAYRVDANSIDVYVDELEIIIEWIGAVRSGLQEREQQPILTVINGRNDR